MKSVRLILSVFLLTCVGAYAQIPSGYYDSCKGLTSGQLLEKLCDVVGPHTNIGYSGLWSLYKESDVRPDGSIWDMYSTSSYTPGGDQCGNYTSVGDCYNREHSFPKSWFDDASPMYSDAFHIYPTDGKVNGQRGNYPYGECANGSSLSSSGGVKPLGRLGTCTFPGYAGTVFEPDDQYKGDFARSYFYMAACYNDLIEDWNSPMLAGNSYPCYTTWAVDLLLKWHRQDPVSDKEINRNNVVYEWQNNRNPFIDHPELAEYIWGNMMGTGWTPGGVVEPSIDTPADGETIDFGSTAIDVPRIATVVVKGTAIEDDVYVSVSGNGFFASATSLAASAVNSQSGATLTLTYKSATAGTAVGAMTLTSGACKVAVNLLATAYDGLPAGDATNVTECSFVAHWTDVDNTQGATYTLNVYKPDGTQLDGYPVSVNASVQQHLVEGLEPATTYTYTVASQYFTSIAVIVTTASPVPVLSLVALSEPVFSVLPGDSSDAIEVEVYSEYVEGDVTVEVDAPFAISSDKSKWTTALNLSVEDDRFYVRLNECEEGVYAGLLKASAVNCDAESIELVGKCSNEPVFVEDFESDATGMNTYSPSDFYSGNASLWKFSDAGIFNSDYRDKCNGGQSVRFGKNDDSYIAMQQDKQCGAGTVTFYAGAWGSETGRLQVQYSDDRGENWHDAGEPVDISDSELQKYAVAVDVTGNVRIKIQQIEGKRMNVDDVAISDYYGAVGGIGTESVSCSWTAFCRDGQLVVECSKSLSVLVYGADGVVYCSKILGMGENVLSLTPGLYIVSADDTIRRVLIK